MDIDSLVKDIEQLLVYMDSNVDSVNVTATELQKKVFEIMQQGIFNFDTKDGKLVTDQDLRKTLIEIEDRIEKVLNVSIWDKTVANFLNNFQTIQDRNVKLNRTYNELKVDVSLLTPARKLIYDQAEFALMPGLRSQYVQPAKFLLMQQVTGGASIQDAVELLRKWNSGELSSGKGVMGPVPNLQRYATQIARDSSYAVDRTVSTIIKNRYELDHFMYVGGLVEDSRPLCVHLVEHEQPVAFEELPDLIKKYPQGLIKDTDEDNFTQRCGGYNCRHKSFAVRGKIKKS